MISSLKSLLAGAVLVLGFSAIASAQSSAGNITGDALAGESIVIKGDDTGFHRELKINKDGKYTVRRVPTGTYTVVKMDKDGNTGTLQNVTVRIGSTARVE